MYYYNRPGINSNFSDMSRENDYDNYNKRPVRYKISQSDQMNDMQNMQMPNMQMPNMQSMPNMPNMQMPNMQSMPNMPNMQNMMPNERMSNDLSEALMIIQDAIKGESEDAAFYQALVGLAPSAEDKRIITEIRSNGMKHNKMFKQLYYDLTGKTVTADSTVESVQVTNYCDGLKKALMGEQKAVERYRKILFAMKDRKYINMMTEIITDELRHLGLYNYLYSKNNCRA